MTAVLITKVNVRRLQSILILFRHLSIEFHDKVSQIEGPQIAYNRVKAKKNCRSRWS